MALRVLIVPDKFKGTLTARAAAEAISRGWSRTRPQDKVELLPMSDGGDGFGEVMSGLLGARAQKQWTCDAAHRRHAARWWWHSKSKTAIIETANVVGLAMLPPKRFHPFVLDTYGLGKMLVAAADKGCRRVLVGIGGSATNDGGFGMARALGWDFFTSSGGPITRWVQLDKACTARAPHPGSKRRARFDARPIEFIVAVDVQNRLLGSRGATRVYGPQKGLRPGDFPIAERCLRRLARMVAGLLKSNFGEIPGAGAAGGLGFGFAAFLGGQLMPGFELFATEAGLERRLRDASLVITGEGAIDASTFMGKGTGQVARKAGELGIPCLGIAGVIHCGPRQRTHFTELRALTELTSVEDAKARPALWLARSAALLAGNRGTA